MKSSIEQLNPVQYRVSVEITPDEVNKAFENAYRKIQKQARVQGFRPGKAPLGVIRKLYGNNVAGEVHESLINTHLFAALGEQTIRPIASPVVDSKTTPKENELFNFSAIVDTMPTIEIGESEYKGVKVNADTYKVKDETLERELNLLRRRHARTRPIEQGQPAANGMLAAISHTAAQDGIDIPSMRVSSMTVFLGEKELLADMETAILGMTTGETKAVDITLPATYGDADLQGKTLQFKLTLGDLKILDVPNLDDEFAKDLDFASVDAMKDDVKSHLEGRARDMSRQKLETSILDKIVDKHPFEVPPAMVDQVIDSLIQEMQHPNEEARNAALRDADLRQNMLQTAKRRTQNTLVLWHVVQKEKLQVTDEEVTGRVNQTVSSFGMGDPRQTAKLRKTLEPRIRENLIFEKAMDFLIQNANITEIPAEI